jgi:hypothetical protein
MARSKTRANLLKRLDPYWKLEAANTVFIPVMVVLLTEGRIGWVTLVPLLAAVALLAIGTAYWWLKVRQLRGLQPDGGAVLRPIARLQTPVLVLTGLGSLSAALGWIVPGFSEGFADRIAATVCAVLAVLEYVNYYHRQLQHFDNMADFRRMLAGEGFRPSWLARDLAALRKGG